MPESRDEIRFILNAQEVRTTKVGASDTLLDFLRLERRLTGTKEGCAEGDCGACTVLVGRLTDAGLTYEPVNACIRFLASLDACHIVTVEHLRGADGTLHPVQQAMVEHHGSQCGFCTPGFVMSLYALWMEVADPTIQQIETALQGNLCRCTGYEPIIKAAQAATKIGSPAADTLVTERARIAAHLKKLSDGVRVDVRNGTDRAILPADLDDLADALVDMPDATIVAGATDVGLWVTKMLRPISPAIFVGHLRELRSIDVSETTITLGAGASYSDVEETLAATFPHISEYWSRIAGWQVRNMGTIGGNIANGSPIGDTPPLLIALDASVTLRKGSVRRVLPLEAFFIDYGQQDREAGEFVESISIPRSHPDTLHACYKISKRRDEDISSVAAGLAVTVKDEAITAARLAFGGMAATPKRAAHAEAALNGRPFDAAAFDAAAQALAQDFTPLTDWRASANYRMKVAQNLLRRFYMEHASSETPVRLARA